MYTFRPVKAVLKLLSKHCVDLFVMNEDKIYDVT